MSLFNMFKKKPTTELTPPPQPLPQRNDDCWCGSGLKYKKCHADKDQQTLKAIRKQEEKAKAAMRRSPFR
ncbi:SEC-C motif-containing protein [Malonomonas rubra DSM 5091]|uniref:SEC-C motif-containing protein n=1 Tax=Malonomonas rubra DSM 5091 TaxID=1122189 RepID=A0A1M6E2G1_MALRU|nr:SEC-C metal-binding domain-containing protein [Malonomonas rubra]SHI79550.1 SEC-C motif-containing protein [Malonomonas rubra DSM 5091]